MRVYTRPGVEAALLQLQDEEGLDVPLLLALCHAGLRGTVLGGDALASLIEAGAAWRQRATEPLRRLRRDLKKPIQGIDDSRREALRAQIKAAEIEAEHVAIDRLGSLLPPPARSDPLMAIQTNLDSYLSVLKHVLSEDGRRQAARLITAALQP